MVNQQLTEAIKECQNGRGESFGVVYDMFVKKIYDYIYFRTHHRPTAEDLTSLIFTKAFENIKSFRESEGNMSAWLYRIARNTLIDHYRTFKKTYEISDAWEIKDKTDLETDLDLRNKLAEVQGYLAELPPEHRDLVIMRVWDGLAYQEIAEIVGKSESAVKMSMSRILTKLRTNLVAVLISFLIFN